MISTTQPIIKKLRKFRTASTEQSFLKEKFITVETGKRKSAIAQVRLFQGSGNIVINGRPYSQYFVRSLQQELVKSPLSLLQQENSYDVWVVVKGGGLSGQAGAVRHGLSKALKISDPNSSALLRTEGFLTRDARVVESKKYGLHKARKRPQFSKR